MKNYSTKNKQLDLRRYLLVSLLIACSGFPTFIFSPSITYPILFVYALYNFIKEKQNIDNYFFIISGIIFTINFIQYVKFDFFSFESTASLFILYIGVYFLIKSIGIDILSKYVAILKILTIVSFVFYLLVIFLPQITAIIINEIAPIFQVETGTFFSHAPTIIFYTFNFDTENFGIPRNSGPFWEPGAFAGFLIIGIIFNMVLEKKKFPKTTIIFIVGIISTFSTTGYIALSFILLAQYLINTRIFLKILILPVIIIVMIYSYNNIPFLGEKIAIDFQSLNIVTADYQYRTRFVSTVLDYYDFLEHPIFGRGKNEATRFVNYGENTGYLKHRNNGVSDFLVQFGTTGFLLYFGAMFFSFKWLINSYDKNSRLVPPILITILIIGLSEKYFNRPFFITMVLLFICQKSKISKKQRETLNVHY